MPGPTSDRKIAINRSIFDRFKKIKCHYSSYSMLHEMKLNKIHKNQNKISIGSPYFQSRACSTDLIHWSLGDVIVILTHIGPWEILM